VKTLLPRKIGEEFPHAEATSSPYVSLCLLVCYVSLQQPKQSYIYFFIFLFVRKPLKFNNFHNKSSNAMELAQMDSSMHKGVPRTLCHGI